MSARHARAGLHNEELFNGKKIEAKRKAALVLIATRSILRRVVTIAGKGTTNMAASTMLTVAALVETG